MSAKNRQVRASSSSRVAMGRRPIRRARRNLVSLGDLISAAYDVTGSAVATAALLSPASPLSHLLGRRIVVA